MPTARITDRGSQSIVTDYLGTPTQMYDAEGNKTWEAQLDIYGRVRTFAGRSLSECPFRYQGQYQDSETGLYYNRFRYYDPSIGGYISQDPLRLEGGIRFFGYVGDSNSWIDTLGLIEEGGFGTFSGTKNTGIQQGNGVQRHHLNQTGVFNFDRDAGQVIGLKGHAATKGTQHYKAHLHMDDFYESFRNMGKIPTVARYNVELYKSLRKSGMGIFKSAKGTGLAILEQLKNGKYPWSKVSNINVKRVAHH